MLNLTGCGWVVFMQQPRGYQAMQSWGGDAPTYVHHAPSHITSENGYRKNVFSIGSEWLTHPGPSEYYIPVHTKITMKHYVKT